MARLRKVRSQADVHAALRRPVIAVAIVIGMASLPLLRPAGPGNTGVADVGLALATLATLLWLSGHGLRIHFPFLWPVLLLIGSGALAASIAGSSPLPLSQDAFVFVWALAVANLAQDPWLLGVLVKGWSYSAVVWGGLLITGVAAGIPWLAGTTARDGSRASFTLGDPNLAANYFLCALFVLRACQQPRTRWKRRLCCTVVLVALGLTLSNGGLLTLLVATMLGWIFGLSRRRGLAPAVVASGVLAMAVAVGVATINVAAITAKAQQSIPLLRDSIGRQGESSGSRSTLLRAEIHMWLTDHTVIGIGPGQVKTTLAAQNASYVKMAHNDYLAALVERGVVGALAMILLCATIAVFCRRIARKGALPAAFAAAVPRPELLGALSISIAISAALYETMHFRHVWAVFGLIAALELATRRTAHPSPDQAAAAAADLTAELVEV